MDKLTFFGMVLSGNGLSCTEEKVKAVKEAREPRTVSETRSFLGLVNYCGRFIPDLATVSEPLRCLTKSIARAETLGYLDKDAPTLVIADASPVGLGAVLTQKQRNGDRNREKIFADRERGAGARMGLRKVPSQCVWCAI